MKIRHKNFRVMLAEREISRAPVTAPWYAYAEAFAGRREKILTQMHFGWTVLKYVNASPEERDHSVIGEFTPRDADGICVYCNHCQPCPMGLNVGLINKYYDLALAGDEMAKGHYQKLPVRADACIQCGHCENRCPFHVKQEARMKEIACYFGE